jgi:hypothetical protein
MPTNDAPRSPDPRAAEARPAGPRGYRRSWKNLLINRQYQLRFTLFMVVLSALLITGLGWWVMAVADDATSVAIVRVRGEACPPLEADAAAPAAAAPAAAPAPVRPATDDPLAPADDRPRVQIDQSSMTLTPATPEDRGQAIAAHWTCELEQAARIRELEAGRRRIFYVLLATGLLLVLGLAAYGITTTHKVAGPLFKIGLYLEKMRAGRYDPVYPLRKGDQLVAFYDHFRSAHAGVVALEQSDVERLRAMLAAAEKAGVAGASPEVDAALAELRAILARKEKALE